jgi:hypothetical protein
MPDGTPPIARPLERGRFNRFLAMLPPHDFSRLAPHLRTVALERGVMLHDAAEEIERVYFPHSGMVSLVTVLQSSATVETATIGCAGVIGANTGLGAKQSVGRASCNCRARRRGSLPPNFMPLPTRARPFAISSCAIMICCSRRCSESQKPPGLRGRSLIGIEILRSTLTLPSNVGFCPGGVFQSGDSNPFTERHVSVRLLTIFWPIPGTVNTG